MRRTRLYLLSAIAAWSVTGTVLLVSADLPAGETAGKIALTWLPLTMLATVFARKPAQEGTKS